MNDKYESEDTRLEKAIKDEYYKIPNESKEMMYHEMYKYNNGYFSELSELDDYCKNNKLDFPNYVWSTERSSIKLNARSILENACEELHEDAYDNIQDEEELQELLDKWCEKQTGTYTYTVDYKYAILTSKRKTSLSWYL